MPPLAIASQNVTREVNANGPYLM